MEANLSGILKFYVVNGAKAQLLQSSGQEVCYKGTGLYVN